jgi:serine phosphatase RsbU (regulator of sigma subunit)
MILRHVVQCLTRRYAVRKNMSSQFRRRRTDAPATAHGAHPADPHRAMPNRRSTDAGPVAPSPDAPIWRTDVPSAHRTRRYTDAPFAAYDRRRSDPGPEARNRRATDVVRDEAVLRRSSDEARHVAVRAEDVAPANVHVRPPDALQREMRRIVENIYGPRLSQLPGLEVGRAYLNSWREDFRYGGDIVDVFHYGRGLTSLAMADISGHGVDAAMYAGLIKHALRAYASRGFSARKCVRALNRLCMENSVFEAADDFYATVFFAIIDADRRSLQYVSAGHEVAFLIEPNRVSQLPVTGPIIGLQADALSIEQKVVVTRPGMTLAMVTDGFTEARNSRGEFLGADAVLDVTATLGSCSAGQQAEALTQYAIDFSDGRLNDDVAALVVKFI